MPLVPGSSDKAIRENIRRSRTEGLPLAQAIAIALSKARKKTGKRLGQRKKQVFIKASGK